MTAPTQRGRGWVVVVVALLGSFAGAVLAFAVGILDGSAVVYFALFNVVALLLFRPRRYPGRP